MRLPRLLLLPLALASVTVPAAAVTIVEFRAQETTVATLGTGYPDLYAPDPMGGGPGLLLLAHFDATAAPVEEGANYAIYAALDAMATVWPASGGDPVDVPLSGGTLRLDLYDPVSDTASYRFEATSADGFLFWMSGFAEGDPAFVPSLAFPSAFPPYPDFGYTRYDVGVDGPEWKAFTDYLQFPPTLTVIRDGNPSEVPETAPVALLCGVALGLMALSRRVCASWDAA